MASGDGGGSDDDTLYPAGYLPSAAQRAAEWPSWEQLLFQLLLWRARHGGSWEVPRPCPVEVETASGARREVDLHRFVADLRKHRRALDGPGAEAGEGEAGDGPSAPNTKTAAAAAVLTPERREVLDNLGFAWSRPRTSGGGGGGGGNRGGIGFKHALWEERYQELVEHYRRTGNAEPRDNKRLFGWCNFQRSQYNEIRGNVARLGVTARRKMGKSEEMSEEAKRKISHSEAFKEVFAKRKVRVRRRCFFVYARGDVSCSRRCRISSHFRKGSTSLDLCGTSVRARAGKKTSKRSSSGKPRTVRRSSCLRFAPAIACLLSHGKVAGYSNMPRQQGTTLGRWCNKNRFVARGVL